MSLCLEDVLHGPSRTRWQFSPGQDFTLATIEELQASGLFHEITLAEGATDADLILHVELKSTRYTAKEYWYGLGLLCAPLLYLGAPMGAATNELDMEFVLEERASGQRLWHKRYYETRDATFFYWSPPDFYYDELLNTILQDVVKNLRASLSTRMSALPHGDDDSPMGLTSDGIPCLLPGKATVRGQEGACNEAGLIGRLQTGPASSWRLRECNGIG